MLEALVHALATGDQNLYGHLRRHGFDLDRSELVGGWPDLPAMPVCCPDLAPSIHFLGRLDHARLRHLFPCADLAVFPSVVPEAYPLVLMEALANVVLPVVSDFSGFREGLDALEGPLGREWVERMRLPATGSRRVETIAAKLDALLADPALPDLKPRLRALAVQRYDWRIRAAEMVRAYERFRSSI